MFLPPQKKETRSLPSLISSRLCYSDISNPYKIVDEIVIIGPQQRLHVPKRYTGSLFGIVLLGSGCGLLTCCFHANFSTTDKKKRKGAHRRVARFLAAAFLPSTRFSNCWSSSPWRLCSSKIYGASITHGMRPPKSYLRLQIRSVPSQVCLQTCSSGP